MSIRWRPIHGGFSRTGQVQFNMVLGGSPSAIGPFGVNLAPAHNEGYGRGIGFEQLDLAQASNFRVRFILNLVMWSATDDGSFRQGSSYVRPGPYGWRFIVSLSTSITPNPNQAVFNAPIFNQVIFMHDYTLSPIYFGGGLNGNTPPSQSPSWRAAARESQWEREFTLPQNTTYVKVELAGANAILRDETIFPIDQIIPEFRPMAIRRSNTWRSLDNPNGFLDIRRNSSWQNIPLINRADENVANRGSSQIRKSGIWRAQSRIGD